MLRATRRAVNAQAGLKVPPMINEPMQSFAPGSMDRELLTAAVARLQARTDLDVPVIINGVEHRPGKMMSREIPSDNKKVFHNYYHADAKLLEEAVEASLAARAKWSATPFEDRAAVVLKAAQLLSTSWRYDFQAATMMGQSKTSWQAEIDSVAESIDFFRFNVKYAEEIYSRQPLSPPGNIWNTVDYRPLEGFTLAISPFNFTAIGANLATAPALMGNTVVWKPSDTSLYSAYLTYKLFEEAGLPAGVINFAPTSAELINEKVIQHRDLSAVVFTGSTKTFGKIWSTVGENITKYKSYPRVLGETGGKNFHLIHTSAHMPTVAAQSVRSAFEYQGQKCSALSRLFAPKSAWPELKKTMLEQVAQIKQGGPEDYSNFMSAVIDETSYNKNKKYIDMAKADDTCTILCGGNPSSEKGWFVPPTIILTTSLDCPLIKEEIFGPVMTIYVYDDKAVDAWKNICTQVDEGTPYGLTGAIFCRDRYPLDEARKQLRWAAGNLYINDKSTGAVVGQQPFGGSRQSGTNDKPGSGDFLQRFLSPRTIKETLEHMPNVSYPHQLPDKF